MTLDPEDPRLDPDTREILRRRAAFIRKSLLGAGLALASLSACGAEACLSPLSPPPAVDTSDSSDASGDMVDDGPQVCLKQDISNDTGTGPDICLTDVWLIPKDADADAADDTPQVCLSPREPDVVDTLGDVPDDAPQICLSPPAPDVIDDVPDAPQICLSPPAPDAGKPG